MATLVGATAMSDNESEVSERTLFGTSKFEEDISDTTNMCRLCMRIKESGSDREFIDISSDNPHSDAPITQLFAFGLSIDVQDTLSTAMPNKVCRDCLAQLYSYTVFKKRSLDVDTRLRHIAARKQKIAEAQALYGPVIFDINAASQFTGNLPSDALYFGTGVDIAVLNTCISTLETKPDNHIAQLVEDEHLQLPSCLVIADTGPSIKGEYRETQSFVRHCKTSNILPTRYELNLVSLDAPGEARPSKTNHSTGNNEEEVNKIHVAQEAPSSCQSMAADSISFVDRETELVQEQACDEKIMASNLKSTNLTVSACDNFQSSDEFSEKILNCDQLAVNLSPSVSIDCSIKKPSMSKRKQGCKTPAIIVPEVYVVETENGKKNLAFKCPLCQETFSSRLSFRSHIPTHGKSNGAVCIHCDKWFQTTNAVRRHERVHSGEKPFKCILCDRCFSQKEILQRHVLTHSDPKPFQCKHCDKNYTQKDALAVHMKNCHTDYEIVQYQCNLCDKAFCHTSGLSRHMAVHSGKQFVCDVCNTRFHDTSSLRRHCKNKHNNEKKK